MASLPSWRFRPERRSRRGTRCREFKCFGTRDKTRERCGWWRRWCGWYNTLDWGSAISGYIFASLALHRRGHTVMQLCCKQRCGGASIERPGAALRRVVWLSSFSFAHSHTLQRLTKCVMSVDLAVWSTRRPLFGGMTTRGRPSQLVLPLFLLFKDVFLAVRKCARYMALSIDQDSSMERIHDARRCTRVYSISNRGTPNIDNSRVPPRRRWLRGKYLRWSARLLFSFHGTRWAARFRFTVRRWWGRSVGRRGWNFERVVSCLEVWEVQRGSLGHTSIRIIGGKWWRGRPNICGFGFTRGGGLYLGGRFLGFARAL